MCDKSAINNRQPIVLYDGECRLCTVSKNLAEKNSGITYEFVSFHSNKGKILSDKYQLKGKKSMYVISDDKIEGKSTVSLSILENMKWWGQVLAYIGKLFPKNFADFIYDIIAKHRR
jgi:predicted DCC family thiol-disulfide oxidoreductase YuxK